MLSLLSFSLMSINLMKKELKIDLNAIQHSLLRSDEHQLDEKRVESGQALCGRLSSLMRRMSINLMKKELKAIVFPFTVTIIRSLMSINLMKKELKEGRF